MAARDPRIDTYIRQAAPFAQPILRHLRAVVHAACPEVEETLKWRMPSFVYHGILCNMAAFKQHAAFGFWKGSLVFDSDKAREAMGTFGRLTSVADLPSKRELTGYIRKAMALNAEGVKAPPKRTARPKPPLRTPPDLGAALRKHAKARATWEGSSPSHRREYVEWITEAKQAETRARRVATTVEWLAEGKSRNWKYERRSPR